MHGLPLRECLTRSLVDFHGVRLHRPDWSDDSHTLALTVRSVTGSPQLWGLQNHSDVTYGTTSGTDSVLAAIPGVLWVEETGGIVVRRDASGRELRSPLMPARPARAISGAFALARDRPRIERMYIYHWRAGASDLFDAGVLRPDGSERPSYAALMNGSARSRPRSPLPPRPA